MAADLPGRPVLPHPGSLRVAGGGPTSTQAGGGCLIEHSIHDVDILRFCFGEVRQVSARTANFAGFEGIEDLAAVTMSFESGLEAQLTSVWHEILTRGSTRRIEVFFRDAMVWLDNEFRGPLHIQTGDGTEVRDCPSPAWVDDLAAGRTTRWAWPCGRTWRRTGPSSTPCTAGTAPEPSLAEAVEAHRLVDAAYRSAAERRSDLALLDVRTLLPVQQRELPVFRV